MTIKLAVDVAMIVLALAGAAIFRRQVVHVYKVGHEDVIKSLSLGCGAGFALALIGKLAGSMLPESKALLVLFAFLLPAAMVGFTTGCGLIAGLTGFDGGEGRFLSILVVGGAAAFASNFFPVGGGFIYAGISAYGLGASILALQCPMEDEAPAVVTVSDDPSPARRAMLGGDLSPLPRSGSEKDAE